MFTSGQRIKFATTGACKNQKTVVEGIVNQYDPLSVIVSFKLPDGKEKTESYLPENLKEIIEKEQK